MTLLAVPIMVESLQQALAAAALAGERGADIVEFRIDRFTSNPQDIAALVKRSPLPCIVTCRPTWEGGLYEGDEAGRLALFDSAYQSSSVAPAYLDVELAAYQRSKPLREKITQLAAPPGPSGNRRESPGLILSSHDFTGRPPDLYQKLETMIAAPECRVVKVAWKARSLRDNLEAFEILQQRHKPTIALCMGEFGLPSRVLAKKFGALLTFASLDTSGGTAPGQPTVEQIKNLYRWDHIGPATRVFGIIAYPVGHSMSPAMHNAGFDATRFDGVYLPLPIPPEYEHFKATMSTWLAAPGLHFRGASVSIPHKENVLRFVRERNNPRDEVEPLAARLGAANTMTVRDDGTLHVSNTDYAAALDAVCDAMGIKRDGLKGVRVAVIGAGGAARAVVAGFADHGATVVVYNRTPEKARALAEQFDQGAAAGKVVAARLEKLCDSCCQVFINCTPIGMSPNVDDTPIPTASETKGWGPGTVVFDTIYNPPQTRLLREARAAGCLTIPGTEMFVRQAAAQFELWTGKDAPLEVFRRVLSERLTPSPSGRGQG